MRIGPCDILAPGTRVASSGRRGVVLGHMETWDQFRSPIVVHRIHWQERYIATRGNVAIYKPIDEKSDCNYSFLSTFP